MRIGEFLPSSRPVWRRRPLHIGVAKMRQMERLGEFGGSGVGLGGEIRDNGQKEKPRCFASILRFG